MNSSILVSDIHAATRKPGARLLPSGQGGTRDIEVTLLFDSMTDYVKTHRVDRVFILGDLFHRRNPSMSTILVVREGLAKLVKAKAQVFILPGNHDAYQKKVGTPYSVSLFDGEEGISVLTVPSTVGSILMLPWVPNGDLPAQLEHLEGSRFDAVCMHQTIQGSETYGSEDSDVTLSQLGKLTNRVFSGHLHNPHQIEEGNVTALYLGSPTQQDFGESEPDKVDRGFWVLRGETCTLVPLRLHGGFWTLRFEGLTGSSRQCADVVTSVESLHVRERKHGTVRVRVRASFIKTTLTSDVEAFREQLGCLAQASSDLEIQFDFQVDPGEGLDVQLGELTDSAEALDEFVDHAGMLPAHRDTVADAGKRYLETAK